MRHRRVRLAALFGALALAAVADPALAQATSDSTTEELIWGLNTWLLYLAVPIAVLVEGILVYTVWKYRNQEEALPTKENRRLEIGWTVATAVVLIAVGIGAYQVMANPYVSASSQATIEEEQDPIEIQVVAQKYFWTYKYPNETVRTVTGEDRNLTTSDTLVIPEGRPVELNVTSKDWLHALHVPGLGLKQDAFPGQYNTVMTKATDTGEYQLYCAEYCGSGHSQMLSTVRVEESGDFEEWLSEQTAG
ncbi:MAG: cytochrome c oxidase subunit II [Salinirussus sp.]